MLVVLRFSLALENNQDGDSATSHKHDARHKQAIHIDISLEFDEPRSLAEPLEEEWV